eukprot:2246209-Rhodomonas_salina.1
MVRYLAKLANSAGTAYAATRCPAVSGTDLCYGATETYSTDLVYGATESYKTDLGYAMLLEPCSTKRGYAMLLSSHTVLN